MPHPHLELTAASIRPQNIPTNQGTEIERRWIVAELPAQFLTLPRIFVQQGYLTPRGQYPEIRVRAHADQYELTIKGEGTLSRTEIQIPISETHFNELWIMTEGARVEKDRIRIPHEGHLIEVDIYRGHAGFLTAEVEFSSVEDSRSFHPPAWFGREVTEEPAFRNRELAR